MTGFTKNLYCVATVFLAGMLSPATGLASDLSTAATPPSFSVGAEMSGATLGPGDSITLATPEIEELDKRVLSVDSDGVVDVPLVGRVKAGGLTTQAFAAQITSLLHRLYLNPQVSISAVEVKSRPISVVGSVNTPGVQQADGHKRLLEVLSSAGGLRQDAGPRIEVTRLLAAGSLPASVSPKASGRFETADISVSDLLEGKSPASNVVILPGDAITVPKARLIYVIGDVKKAGGFVVGEHDNLTVLKALALAEGLQGTADAAHAKIVHPEDAAAASASDGQPLNVRKLLAGKTRDMVLRPDDVLFIPSSLPKKFAVRALEAAIQTGTGIAIWK